MYMKYDPPPPRPHRPSLAERGVLVAFVGIALGVGVLGGLTAAMAREGWYQSLAKPPLTPPDWVFAPVWAALYVLMGIAAWRVWHVPDGVPFRRLSRGRALGLWGAQLGLGLIWTALFFALRSPAIALGGLVVLVLVLAATVWTFQRRDAWAGALMAPTLPWVLFAGYINAGIVVMN